MSQYENHVRVDFKEQIGWSYGHQ